jgi:hypothetical protein
MEADVEEKTMKTMIEFSETWEDADEIITEFTTYKTNAEKRDYVLELFKGSVSILCGYDGADTDKAEADYRSLLSAIVNLKWR